MMTQIILGRDEDLLSWAEKNFPNIGPFARPATCIGIASQDGSKIYGVVIYTNYHYYDIEVSIVTSDPRWATPQVIKVIFDYPFNQLGVKRMTAFTAKSNKRARKLNEGVGFKLEGVHPFGWDGKEASCSYGIYKENVYGRWL